MVKISPTLEKGFKWFKRVAFVKMAQNSNDESYVAHVKEARNGQNKSLSRKWLKKWFMSNMACFIFKCYE